MLTITDNGEYQLRYNDFISLMIKAIQELKEEISIKDRKISALEKQLNELVSLKEEITSLQKVLSEIRKEQSDNGKLVVNN